MGLPAHNLTDTHATARLAAELAASGSLEIGAKRPDDVRAIAENLPAGTRVFVNHLPRHDLAQSLNTLIALRKAGLEPVPHIAARRIATKPELKAFLDRACGEAGVAKALVIGGDVERPLGPFADGLSLVSDTLLAASGIREVYLPSYPEGHPKIALDVLQTALSAKLSAARAQGFGATILTQFSFQPARVIDHVAALNRRHPQTSVYIGFAGPTSPVSLLRFAQACGVGATLRALSREGMRAVDLVTHTDPAEQLTAIARYLSGLQQSNVAGVHLFSFGNVAASAMWLNEAMRGGK